MEQRPILVYTVCLVIKTTSAQLKIKVTSDSNQEISEMYNDLV